MILAVVLIKKRPQKFLSLPFFLFVSTFLIFYIGYAEEIIINYEYNPLGICIGAKAFLRNGKIVGEARLIHLERGKYYEVEERHMSQDGKITYNAISKFSIGLGIKIDEKKIFGEKKTELFSSWPR